MDGIDSTCLVLETDKYRLAAIPGADRCLWHRKETPIMPGRTHVITFKWRDEWWAAAMALQHLDVKTFNEMGERHMTRTATIGHVDAGKTSLTLAAAALVASGMFKER